MYGKLLLFVDTTIHYRVDRLLGMLPSDGTRLSAYNDLLSTDMHADLFETRAILLGRLGRHDSALEIYVYRLRDYDKAERYAVHDPFHRAILNFYRHGQILQANTSTRHRKPQHIFHAPTDLLAPSGPDDG